MASNSPPEQQKHEVYWRRVMALTLLLLLAWFAITVGVLFFARELSNVIILGWPLSFYMAAQGMVLVYLLIVAIYVVCMRKLDHILQSETMDVQ